jgi:hypothetical protein
VQLPNGALRIFLYNLPIYAGTWAGAAAVAAAATLAPGWVRPWIWAACAAAVLWSAASLAVSHYVYNVSALRRGEWARSLAAAGAGPWISIEVGIDPTIDLSAFPVTLAARFDVFQGGRAGGASTERARRLATSMEGTLPAAADALPMRAHSCGTMLLLFSAHEVRDRQLRDRLFSEVRRVLAPRGRLLLVEHVRDLPNFLAFGPGFLHFESRAEWVRATRAGGLELKLEQRITPWVVAMALEEPA